jgi:hypothetical protein
MRYLTALQVAKILCRLWWIGEWISDIGEVILTEENRSTRTENMS